MLPKKNRLTKKKDFDQVFEKGRSVYSGSLGLRFLKNGQKFNRFGILVSTKVSKSAVARNLLKRRIRVIIKSHNPQLKQGYDCVFISKPGLIELSFDDLNNSVGQLLKLGALIK